MTALTRSARSAAEPPISAARTIGIIVSSFVASSCRGQESQNRCILLHIANDMPREALPV
jgi:hypothetical protein